MPFWVQMLLSLAAFALLLALVAAVWALRGVARRAEAVLSIVEQELRPLIGQALALTEDVRGLTREAGRELERVGAVSDRVALRMTPKTGAQARELLAERGGEVARRAQEFATEAQGRAGDWLDKSRELFEEQTQRLMSAFEAGRDAMREEIRRGSTESRG